MHASTKAPGEPAISQADSGSSLRTFRALQYRDFRLLWTGLAVSAVGTWMQIVALSLLVLDITHGSAVALGTLSLTQALSFLLFAAIGGSVADRFDKRRLLLVTQSLMMGFAVLLGILTLTGLIRFWVILLVAFTSSSALSLDQPARNALVTSLVPKEHLMNAVSLQSAVFNGASILGPALAGLSLSRIGYSGNFFLNAASFCAHPNRRPFPGSVEECSIPCARRSDTCATMPCCLVLFQLTQRCCFLVPRQRWRSPFLPKKFCTLVRRNSACCFRPLEPARSWVH